MSTSDRATYPDCGDAPLIAALVFNSVNHDVRVLKEADSLAEAGHRVVIVGIQDKRCPDRSTKRPSGVRIVRVDRGGPLRLFRYRLKYYAWLLVMIICAGVALTALISPPFWTGITGSAPVQSVFQSYEEWFFEPHSHLVVLALGLALFSIPRVVRWRRRVLNEAMALRSSALADEPRATGRLGVLSVLLAQYRRMPSVLLAIVGRYQLRKLYLKVLEDLNPSHVHCHDAPTLPIAVTYGRRHPETRLIYDSHELFEEIANLSSLQRRHWRSVQRRASASVDACITVNDSIAAELVHRFPKLPTPLVVKNASVLPKEPIVDDGRLRLAAGIDNGANILLYQGGFAQHRGLEHLVRAAALFPSEWCLIMMGWGVIEDTLKAIADDIDPEGCAVRFLPGVPQSELPWWTAGASLGVIPYENTCLNHWYCTPNKLWEYPIAGVPMLVSPFPEMLRTLDEYGVGISLDDPMSAEGIAATVSSVSPEQLRRMRQACRGYVELDNWEVYSRRMIGLYEDLNRSEALQCDRLPAASV